MADTKSTGLTELAAIPSSGDFIAVIDVSDTSGGSAGTPKKNQYTNLVPIAAGSDVTTGTDNAKLVTSKALKDAHVLDHTLAIPIPIVNGVGENTTSTSYDDMAYWKALFDKTAYTNIVSITFQVLLQQDNSGGPYQVWCQLVKTSGTVITGSEVTDTLGQFATSTKTSGDISANLTAGLDGYRVQAKTASGGKADIQAANIIVNMKV